MLLRRFKGALSDRHFSQKVEIACVSRGECALIRDKQMVYNKHTMHTGINII